MQAGPPLEYHSRDEAVSLNQVKRFSLPSFLDKSNSPSRTTVQLLQCSTRLSCVCGDFYEEAFTYRAQFGAAWSCWAVTHLALLYFFGPVATSSQSRPDYSRVVKRLQTTVLHLATNLQSSAKCPNGEQLSVVLGQLYCRQSYHGWLCNAWRDCCCPTSFHQVYSLSPTRPYCCSFFYCFSVCSALCHFHEVVSAQICKLRARVTA